MPGGNNVAVMDIQTEADGSRPGENFLVARYSKDCHGARSSAASSSTRRQIGTRSVQPDDGRSTRCDAPIPTFSIHSFVAKTSTPGIDRDQNAFHARALFLNTKWQTYGEFTDIDDNFNAEVGFVPRRGIRQTKFHLERNPRPGGIIRVMEPM